MAAIATSAIVEDAVQVSGRRHIHERHSESDGMAHDFVWMAESGQDATAGLAARATWLETELVDREQEANALKAEEGAAGFTTRYTTPLQFVQFLRSRFASASGAVAARIAVFFLARTDTQLRTAFSMSQAQVNALRVRLQAKVDKFIALNAVVGE